MVKNKYKLNLYLNVSSRHADEVRLFPSWYDALDYMETRPEFKMGIVFDDQGGVVEFVTRYID